MTAPICLEETLNLTPSFTMRSKLKFLFVYLCILNLNNIQISHSKSGDETGKNFEGDIDLNGEKMVKVGKNVAVVQSEHVRKWPSRVIPVAISDDFNVDEKQVIVGAMEEMMRETCIVLEPRTPDKRDFVFIQRGSTCMSKVGHAGGRQNLTLRVSEDPRVNCVTHGLVLHELMHAVGFWHEQSRPDRDKFIRIIDKNIRHGRLNDFMMRPDVNSFGLPYDYSSILHYSKDALQRRPTDITIVTSIQGAPIGLRNHLSHFDKIKVNRLYRCSKYHDS